MTPSVSPETDRELSDGALFYAREGGTEVGLAFITEFERALALSDRKSLHARLPGGFLQIFIERRQRQSLPHGKLQIRGIVG